MSKIKSWARSAEAEPGCHFNLFYFVKKDFRLHPSRRFIFQKRAFLFVPHKMGFLLQSLTRTYISNLKFNFQTYIMLREGWPAGARPDIKKQLNNKR